LSQSFLIHRKHPGPIRNFFGDPPCTVSPWQPASLRRTTIAREYPRHDPTCPTRITLMPVINKRYRGSAVPPAVQNKPSPVKKPARDGAKSAVHAGLADPMPVAAGVHAIRAVGGMMKRLWQGRKSRYVTQRPG
jgi:hypothetical protein